MNNNVNFSVAGCGYVGFSLAVLLSQYYPTVCYDIDDKKINDISLKKSPIDDSLIDKFLKKKLNLNATSDPHEAFSNCDYLIVSTPTNYNPDSKRFDTNSIEKVIENALQINKNIFIIIKSTIPVGYTDYLKSKFNYEDISFSPEFLREGFSIKDNLYPSRIVIGSKKKKAKFFVDTLIKIAIKENIEVVYSSNSEAESIKLFSNTYLAMRVSFFNEVDAFCETLNLNSKEVILGISSDPRVGNFYNNPSFGYGGYCLPKDTKQMDSIYEENNIPNSLISSIVKSNHIRKKYIAEQVKKHRPKTVGIYRLIMKNNSDNFRSSAIIDIINELISYKINVIIYEPSLKNVEFYKDFKLVNELENFISLSDLILANRLSDDLKNINKVYTRDIFNIDL